MDLILSSKRPAEGESKPTTAKVPKLNSPTRKAVVSTLVTESVAAGTARVASSAAAPSSPKRASPQKILSPRKSEASSTTVSVTKPASPIKKPASPMKKPASPLKKPASPVKKPASPIKKPASPIKNPASPVKKPASPVKKSTEPLPILTGKYKVECGIASWEGVWGFDKTGIDSGATSKFAFKSRGSGSAAAAGGSVVLGGPVNGVYDGYFNFKVQHAPARKIPEKGVHLTFTKIDGASNGEYSVKGKGANRFGAFVLVGKLSSNGNLQVTKEYTT